MRQSIGFLLALAAVGLSPLAAKPIEVLILSGQNNHAWQETTPFIEGFLNETGRFRVRTTFHPEDLTEQQLAGVDVLISEWNTFEIANNNAVNVTAWPETARNAYVDFVRRGGGHVCIHAGGSSFADWSDYHAINLVRWDRGVTSHGPQHRFRVRLDHPEHPILLGLSDFETWDELWKDVGIHPTAEVLASSWSRVEDVSFGAKEPSRAGSFEPSILVGRFGNGRCFSTTFGHNAQALADSTKQLIIARGVEWAATGEVTIPVDTFRAEEKLSWQRTRHSLALLKGQVPLWQFNAGPNGSKPHFHPLRMPDGTVITGMRPADHIWHQGAWFSWKFLNQKNFWEEDRRHRPKDGVSEVTGVRFRVEDDYSAQIELTVRYATHAGPVHRAHINDEGEHLLTEQRTIRINAPTSRGGYSITSHHKFKAEADTRVDEYFYGGFSLRIHPGERDSWTFLDAQGNTWGRGESTLKEFKHPYILTGPPSPWVAFVENPRQPTQGIAILDHANNPRHPVQWLIITSMPFFSPVVHYGDDLFLPKGEILELRYQIIVFDGHVPLPFLSEAQRTFDQQF